MTRCMDAGNTDFASGDNERPNLEDRKTKNPPAKVPVYAHAMFGEIASASALRHASYAHAMFGDIASASALRHATLRTRNVWRYCKRLCLASC